MNLIRVFPKETPSFLASKWLHLDLLIDVDEMKDLLASIMQRVGNLFLFSSQGVQPQGQNTLQIEQFLLIWEKYTGELRSGQIPKDSEYRFFFTAIVTCLAEAVRAIDLPQGKEIITPYEPIVQMQLHRFIYSKTDHTFRSMIFGAESISWGIRLSYPQIFQYPQTRAIEDALDEKRFPNSSIFSCIRQWIREHTMPTPFVVDGKRTNVPIRIGKGCLDWINTHQELVKKNIQVQLSSSIKFKDR